ncbi:MAG: LacI family DNA-binding transcriptional regulator [Planctomycetota bacterium]|nr:LacI family DNA-binding transcriptional regulator [Planctomycetota bacterium]
MAGIREIARAAGVSTATVSRALTNPQSVSEDLRQKVRTAAAELNYRPETARRGKRAKSPSARPQRLGQTAAAPTPSGRAPGANGSVLLFIPHTHAAAIHDRSVGYFAYVFSGMMRKIEELGLSMSLTPYSAGHLGELLAPDHLQRQQRAGAKGMVFLFSNRDEDRLLLNTHTPLPWVALNRNLPGAELTVRSDDRHGAREAAAYLLSQGHKNIAVIAGPSRYQFFEERLLGLKEALAAAKVPLPAERLARVELSRDEGREAARRLLSKPKGQRPTALFACEEAFADGALQAADALGLKVPEDFSIVAFSDFVLSSQSRKAVTAVSVPAFELGYLAVEALLNKCRVGMGMRAEIVLTPRMVVRQSVEMPT